MVKNSKGTCGYSHGGDIYKYGHEIIDFSANINPLGMIETVKKAICENVDVYDIYPDPFNRELVNKLSKKYGIDGDDIVCGNGAADLIYRITLYLKPKKALVLAPTFSEYEEAVKLVGGAVKYHYLKEEYDYKVKGDVIDSIEEDLDIIFLCSPNNPTGIPMEKIILERIINEALKKKVTVVVDHCFIDFLSEKDDYQVFDLLLKYPNLIVLNAATKIYAMAGLRLGYGFFGDADIAQGVRNTLQPWSVSTVALKAGLSIIENESFINDTCSYVDNERNRLIKALQSFGLKTFPSKVNYILFKGDKNLGKQLEERGIILRYCNNFMGLDEEFYRIAVKNNVENSMLIDALKDIYII